ncbi:hypothetical protein NW756_002985 [Fusarium oxysporum]|nr:hypothetical protein NW756_002985 [Fusarium oxysporum]
MSGLDFMRLPYHRHRRLPDYESYYVRRYRSPNIKINDYPIGWYVPSGLQDTMDDSNLQCFHSLWLSATLDDHENIPYPPPILTRLTTCTAALLLATRRKPSVGDLESRTNNEDDPRGAYVP